MLKRALPDVTSDSSAELPFTLQWVGMEEIAVPVAISIPNNIPIPNKEQTVENRQTVSAKANVYISLDQPEAKGIHMSRLHAVMNELAYQDFNKETVNQTLDTLIESQSGVGHAAKIQLSFELMLKKQALLSGESGYQSYPVILSAEKHGKALSCEFELTIPYSSTCPCSASLARQLYADAIRTQFSASTIDKADLLDWIQSSAGSVATPHSQRSYTYIRLALEANDWPCMASLIFELEDTIGTPVQTAVKRIDEQEFARLNAENLMFCEDAARRIKFSLENMAAVRNYWFKVDHQESLHAHNAVVIDEKFSGQTSS